MTRTTLSLIITIGLALSGGCSTMSGREILQRSAEKLQSVKTISYQADYTSTGWVKPLVADVNGSVVLGSRSEWDIDRFHCEVTIKKDGEDETLHYEAGSDGDVYFLIDPKTKTAYQDMDPLVLGSDGRNVQRVLFRDYSADQPFEEELKAESIERGDDLTVAGEPCYVIHIKPKNPPEIVLSISKRDFLPRQVLRIHPNRREPDGEPGTTQLAIRNLKINPTLERNPYKLVLPMGYTKTDEFAD